MTRVTLWGTSFSKLGDEAQLVALATLLRSLEPRLDLTLLARPREKAARLYPDIRQIRLADFPRSVRQIRRSDLLIVVGAPFYEDWRQMLGCLWVFACARALGVPIVVYGVTLFELKTRFGKYFYSKLLDRVQLIAVRERIGQEMLNRLGVASPVVLISDPRAALGGSGKESLDACLEAACVDPRAPIISVTTRYIDENAPTWVKRDHGFATDHVRNAAAALSQSVAALARVAQVVVLPMHPRADEDEAMVALLREGVDDPASIHVLPRDLGAGDVIELLGRSEMVVSSRLASTVLALGRATPIVALAYEERQHDVMDRFGEAALVIDWRSLRAGQLEELCERVWRSRAAIRARLAVQAEEAVRRAVADVNLLAPYLGGR